MLKMGKATSRRCSVPATAWRPDAYGCVFGFAGVRPLSEYVGGVPV